MKDLICYYINLSQDVERNNHISKELEKVFDKNQIVRIEGTLEKKTPYIGCSLSHIKCLNAFIESKKDYAIIFEDDFQFELPTEKMKEAIQQAIDNSVKLFLLGYHTLVINLELHFKDGYLCPFKNGQMACGYMVSKSFVNILLENFKKSTDMLLKTNNYEKYALDQYWKSTQQMSGVYACVPRGGKQKSFYSNIEKKVIDYQGFCYICVLEDYNEELHNQMKDICPYQFSEFKMDHKKSKSQNMKDAICDTFSKYRNVDYICLIDKYILEIEDINFLNMIFKEISINKEYHATYKNNIIINKYIAYILENTKDTPDIYELVEKISKKIL
jgi:GR25 family glycosyltransferase involved in LPS biosynthesis